MTLSLVHNEAPQITRGTLTLLAGVLGPPIHYPQTAPAGDTLSMSVRRLERFLDYGGEFGPCAIHRVGPTDWECRPLDTHTDRHVGRGITLHDAIDDLVGVYSGQIRAS